MIEARSRAGSTSGMAFDMSNGVIFIRGLCFSIVVGITSTLKSSIVIYGACACLLSG